MDGFVTSARLRGRRRLLQGTLALAGLGLLAGCGVLPPRTPQPGKVWQVGFLGPTSPQPYYEALSQGLSELGYTEGQNLAIEYRYAGGKFELLPELAAELVRLEVDVIVAAGNLASRAAKASSSRIPIVMGISADPFESGLVASLARPGGNVTGVANLTSELTSKHLDLLKETIPGISRVAVLANAANPAMLPQWREAEQSARVARLQLQLLEVREDGDLARMLDLATGGRAEALLVLDDPTFTARRTELVNLAAKARLPAMYANGEIARVGGLMVYGANFYDQFRRAATYVDKILKGAKPADLPVERAIRFDFIVNMTTAQALGLTVPETVLRQATEIIP